jgi:hypothetical protein
MPRRWPSYPRLLGLSALALLSIAGSLIFTAAHNRSLAAAFGFTGVGLSLAAFTWAVVLMAQRRRWLWMVYLVTALGYSVISLFFPFPYPWSFLGFAFSPFIVFLTALIGPTTARRR